MKTLQKLSEKSTNNSKANLSINVNHNNNNTKTSFFNPKANLTVTPNKVVNKSILKKTTIEINTKQSIDKSENNPNSAIDPIENYNNKVNNLLDKLISNLGNDQNNLLDKKSENFAKKLKNSYKSFKKFNITSPREENLEVVLVENKFIQNLKNENKSLEKEIMEKKKKFENRKIDAMKTIGENNFLKQMSENQEKLKIENIKLVDNLNLEIKQTEKFINSQKSILAKEKIDKDNLFRIILSKLKQNKLDQEFLQFFNTLSNKNFIISNLGENSIESSLGKISKLEKQLNVLNFEINKLEKLNVIEKKLKKQETLQSLKSKTSFKSTKNI